MSAAAGSAFKVALVQMRSAMEPKANLRCGARRDRGSKKRRR